MRTSIFYSYLLVCLVYVNVGFSLPTNLNVTDSSPPNNHHLTEDEASDSEKNEDTKLNTLGPEIGDEMGSSPPSSRKPLKDIPSAWETRGLFSPRRSRGLYRSMFGRRGDNYGMSPRSFSKMNRQFGYGGGRFPGGRFGRFAPYGRYDRDEYNMMGNYQPYPQRYEGSPRYDRQPYGSQTFPNYQQTEQFPSQYQNQYLQPQQSYLRPPAEASLAPAQSYYRDPYTHSQQPPQQFASSTPTYFPDAQQMNVRPQSIPPSSSSSSYYTNGRPVASELQRVDSFSPDRRTGAGSQTLMATPTQQTDRYQPTGALEIPPTGSSFDRFGTSSLQPSAVGERDGARSRTQLNMVPTTVQGNRDRPIGTEIQRTPTSLDQFRTSSTQSADQRNGSGSSAGLRENRENGDRLGQSASEFPRTSDQLQTYSSGQRDGPQPSAVETASAPSAQENDEQSRPLSGLFSFLRSPSSATATDSNTLQSSRSIVGFGPQETQEQPKIQSQAATVAA